MLFAGIDPGRKGCLCVLDSDAWTLGFHDWPKNGDIFAYWKEISPLLAKTGMCVLEKVHAMPKQGVASTFSFGVNFGIWQGWLCAAGAPTTLVQPREWMKGRNISPGGKIKEQVMLEARRLFPEAGFSGPKGGYLDGRGDAALMAYYAFTIRGRE